MTKIITKAQPSIPNRRSLRLRPVANLVANPIRWAGTHLRSSCSTNPFPAQPRQADIGRRRAFPALNRSAIHYLLAVVERRCAHRALSFLALRPPAAPARVHNSLTQSRPTPVHSPDNMLAGPPKSKPTPPPTLARAGPWCIVASCAQPGIHSPTSRRASPRHVAPRPNQSIPDTIPSSFATTFSRPGLASWCSTTSTPHPVRNHSLHTPNHSDLDHPRPPRQCSG